MFAQTIYPNLQGRRVEFAGMRPLRTLRMFAVEVRKILAFFQWYSYPQTENFSYFLENFNYSLISL